MVQVNGGSIEEKVDFGYSLFEQTVSVDSVFQPNEMLDTIAITKGKGTEGVVTRWGVTRLPRKTHRGLRKVNIKFSIYLQPVFLCFFFFRYVLCKDVCISRRHCSSRGSDDSIDADALIGSTAGTVPAFCGNCAVVSSGAMVYAMHDYQLQILCSHACFRDLS